MTWCAHGGISKKNLVAYLHMINETLSHKFHPYSILTGDTMAEFVIYCVLSEQDVISEQGGRIFSFST